MTKTVRGWLAVLETVLPVVFGFVLLLLLVFGAVGFLAVKELAHLARPYTAVPSPLPAVPAHAPRHG